MTKGRSVLLPTSLVVSETTMSETTLDDPVRTNPGMGCWERDSVDGYHTTFIIQLAGTLAYNIRWRTFYLYIAGEGEIRWKILLNSSKPYGGNKGLFTRSTHVASRMAMLTALEISQVSSPNSTISPGWASQLFGFHPSILRRWSTSVMM